MQCVILAGGLGTRLRGIAPDIPKTLIEVSGRPFAAHQLSWLAAQGVREVVYAIGHLGDQVRAFVGDGARWGLSVTYVEDGVAPKGTAGAIRGALDAGLLGRGFLVLYGDSYLPIEIEPVWRASSHGAVPLMTVFRNDGRWDSSNVRFEDGRIVLYEKGRPDAAAMGMRHIDYGLSVLTRDVIEEVVLPGAVADLSGVLHRLSVEGRLTGLEVSTRFYEIGSPQGLADLESHLSA